MKSSDINIEFPVVGIEPPEPPVTTKQVPPTKVNQVVDLVRYTLSRSQLDNSSFDWEFFERELKNII